MEASATCKTCPFWLERRPATETEPGLGTCKRYPPSPMPSAGQLLPKMLDADWCGEHPQRRPARQKLGPALVAEARDARRGKRAPKAS